MPDPTPTPPASTAPAPVTTQQASNPPPAAPPPETPATEPQPPEIPASGMDDPLLRRLFEDFGHVPPIVAAPSPTPTPAPAPVTTPPSPTAPTTPPAPAPARKLDVTPMPEEPTPPAPDAPPVSPTPPAPPTPDAFEASLTEEQSDELAEYRWASAHIDKYKGHAEKLMAWYKSYDEKVAKHLADNPDHELDEDDDFLQNLRKTKPAIQAFDQRKVQRGLAEEAALERLKRERADEDKAAKEKLAAIERKTRELEMKPVLDAQAQQFEAFVAGEMAKDANSPASEITKALLANEEQGKAKDPLAADIIINETRKGANVAREWLKFANNLATYDPKNETHRFLAEFVAKQCNEFAQRGGDKRVKDGKTFIPRQQWAELQASDPAKLAKHWTFDEKDVLLFLALNTKGSIENAISNTKDWMKRYNLTHVPPTSSATPPNLPADQHLEPITPPLSRTPQSRGPAEVPPHPGANPNDIDVVAIMDYMTTMP